MVMAGISSKAAGKPENKRKFNAGSELQNQEFIDGSGLELYDVQARFFDSQIGRFIQVDPMPDEVGQESWSPYQFTLNNPITKNDPDGKVWNFVIGAIVGAAVEYGTQVANNLITGQSLGDALTNVNSGSILIAAGAGAVSSGASALVPRGVVASVAKAVASTAVDAAESVTKQYVETGDVSAKQVLNDVAANKVGGLMAGKVNTAAIKTSENQLKRVENIAIGDATSSGRQKAVSNAQTKVAAANAPKQAAAGMAGSAVGAAAAVIQNSKPPKFVWVQPSNKNVSDATSVRLKLPRSFLQ
jgi:RHS repeat-associated protein